MNYLRGFSFNMASTLVVFSLGFVNTSLLAHALGREQYGVLKLWTVLVLLGGLVLAEWLNKGGTYVVGRLRARNAAVDASVLYAVAMAGVLLLSAPLTLGLGQLLIPGLSLPVWLTGLGLIVFTVLEKGQLGVLLGDGRMRMYSLLPLVFVAAYLLGNLALAWQGQVELDQAMAVWLAALGLAVAVGMAAFIGTGWRPALPDRDTWGHMLRVGARGEVALVLVFLLFKSDVFLVSHYLGPASVGVYGVATNFTDMMQRVPNVAAVVLFSKVVRGEDSGRLTLQVARWVLWFSLACALTLVGLGRLLLAVAFPDYPDAYAPLVWLLPGMVFSGCGSVFNSRLIGQGYPPVTVWAPATALGVNVGLNLWLIPSLGVIGAALSTSVAYTLWGLLVAWRCLRQWDAGWREVVRPPWRRTVRQEDPGVSQGGAP